MLIKYVFQKTTLYIYNIEAKDMSYFTASVITHVRITGNYACTNNRELHIYE